MQFDDDDDDDDSLEYNNNDEDNNNYIDNDNDSENDNDSDLMITEETIRDNGNHVNASINNYKTKSNATGSDFNNLSLEKQQQQQKEQKQKQQQKQQGMSLFHDDDDDERNSTLDATIVGAGATKQTDNGDDDEDDNAQKKTTAETTAKKSVTATGTNNKTTAVSSKSQISAALETLMKATRDVETAIATANDEHSHSTVEELQEKVTSLTEKVDASKKEVKTLKAQIKTLVIKFKERNETLLRAMLDRDDLAEDKQDLKDTLLALQTKLKQMIMAPNEQTTGTAAATSTAARTSAGKQTTTSANAAAATSDRRSTGASRTSKAAATNAANAPGEADTTTKKKRKGRTSSAGGAVAKDAPGGDVPKSIRSRSTNPKKTAAAAAAIPNGGARAGVVDDPGNDSDTIDEADLKSLKRRRRVSRVAPGNYQADDFLDSDGDDDDDDDDQENDPYAVMKGRTKRAADHNAMSDNNSMSSISADGGGGREKKTNQKTRRGRPKGVKNDARGGKMGAVADGDDIGRPPTGGGGAGTRRFIPWGERFDELKAYIAANGHANVPLGYGALGKWVNNQRYTYSKSTMNAERIHKLESIGFVWRIRERENGPSSAAGAATATGLIKTEARVGRDVVVDDFSL